MVMRRDESCFGTPRSPPLGCVEFDMVATKWCTRLESGESLDLSRQGKAMVGVGSCSPAAALKWWVSNKFMNFIPNLQKNAATSWSV